MRGIRFAAALDKLFNVLLVAFLAALMGLGFYSLADNSYIYANATDDSILSYKPEPGLPADERKAISKDQVAWLCIPESRVDYPVLQGKDNTEYLNRDPYGEFSYSGSIFLDHRNSPDFSDSLNVVYGHHMSNGWMFGCLDDFRDEQFLKDHRKGIVSTSDATFEIELFAVFECLATEPRIFSPGSRYTAEAEEYIIERSGAGSAPTGERIIALTTCTDGMDDSRLIVCGYLRPVED